MREERKNHFKEVIIGLFITVIGGILVVQYQEGLHEPKLAPYSSGKISGWDYREVNGKVKSFTTREFDAEKDINGNWNKKQSPTIGRFISECEFNQEGRLLVEKIYDSKNEKIIAESEYIFENNILTKIRINNFEEGTTRDIKITKIEPEYKIFEINDDGYVTTYEWLGNRICKDVSNEGDYSRTTSHTYDKNGNLFNEITTLNWKVKLDESFNFKYEVINSDQSNNWTVLLCINSIGEGSIRERAIVYY